MFFPKKIAFLWVLFLVVFMGQAQGSVWDGFKVNLNAGGYGVFRRVHESDKKKVGPTFELGAEYGRSFGSEDQFYLGSDIIFHASFPDSFEKSTITLFGNDYKVYPGAVPIVDVVFGYNFNEKTQVFIGSAYLWGLVVGARHFVSEKMFVSFKVVTWMDRVFFDRGLHDGYAVIGLGFRL